MKKASTYKSKKPDARGFVDYTPQEHAIWGSLFNRQMEIIKNRACDEYIQGIHTLGLSDQKIPQLPEVNERLQATTGWAVEPVPALIGFDRFFGLLADRKFPAATFIRREDELEYLEEPDIFHEIFGHCPLLTNQTYADFMEGFAKVAKDATHEEQVKLAALYWFTVEFGLIQTEHGLRAYGGGILSSIGETPYSLESSTPKRQPLDLLETFRTPYRIDIFQSVYFVIESFSDLYDINQQDLLSLIAKAKRLGMHKPLYEVCD